MDLPEKPQLERYSNAQTGKIASKGTKITLFCHTEIFITLYFTNGYMKFLTLKLAKTLRMSHRVDYQSLFYNDLRQIVTPIFKFLPSS